MNCWFYADPADPIAQLYGYYDMLRDYDKLTDDQSRQSLVRGDCYAAAMVLNDELGWPISGLLVDLGDRKWLSHVVHAFLVSPDGRLFDASGFTTHSEIEKRYLFCDRAKNTRNPRFEEFGDSQDFRRALRPLHDGASFDENHTYYDPDFDFDRPTEYDKALDVGLPSVRRAIERLELVELALSEYPRSQFAA